VAFRPKPVDETVAETPELLFDALPRRRGAPRTLWTQQSDALRAYSKTFDRSNDVALELPTGTGKTLTGLLIAEWWKRKHGKPVIFACPTKQLVNQVVGSAERQGISVVNLSGPSQQWAPADQQAYLSSKQIAVTSYSSVFNSNPKVGNPSLIVFDDAHAGEQYIASAFTLKIDRSRNAEVYEDVVSLLRPILNRELHARLIATTRDTSSSVEAIYLNRYEQELVAPLQRLFDLKLSAGAARYEWKTLKGHLAASVLYASWQALEIRPSIAPTFENAPFIGADQRLYLSATLGNGGELERAFGRPQIRRIQQQPGRPSPKSGRRFFVFPQLVSDSDPDDPTKELVKLAGRSVVLTPSDYEAKAAEEALLPADWTALHAQDVESSFTKFTKGNNTVCFLANRYDGLDLPGNSCRVVVLSGYPRATNLHERFLASRARAGAALAERIRSRIIQGSGRCTRGPEDWALVIVRDLDNTNFLAQSEIQQTFDAELQAEVRFGLEQSKASSRDILENVAMFLEFGDPWSVNAEPIIAEYRQEAKLISPEGSEAMSSAVKHEVLGSQAAWHFDWATSATEYATAADKLTVSPHVRSVRAVFEFTAASAKYADYRMSGSVVARREASALAARAVADAVPTTWMKSMLPFPGDARTLTTEDDIAVRALGSAINRLSGIAAHVASLTKLHEQLASTDHAQFEPGLTTLGELLGAEAFKPTGDGRCDGAWCWGDDLWITIEAKTEHHEDGQIGLEDVRQTNEHLKLLSADRGAPVPQDSVSVLTSPRETFVGDALTIAEAHVYRADPSVFVDLAREAEGMWLELRTIKPVTDAAERLESVRQIVDQRRLLPRDILDRLTAERVRPVV
jgi:hypothetical protein